MFKTQNGMRAFHCESVQRNRDNTPGFYVDLIWERFAVLWKRTRPALLLSNQQKEVRTDSRMTSQVQEGTQQQKARYSRVLSLKKVSFPRLFIDSHTAQIPTNQPLIRVLSTAIGAITSDILQDHFLEQVLLTSCSHHDTSFLFMVSSQTNSDLICKGTFS